MYISDNSSLIKFGGWDMEGILNSDVSKMTMLKTIHKTNWALSAPWISQGYYSAEEQIDEMVMVTTTPRFVVLAPDVPYIYVPEDDFIKLITFMGVGYKD